MTKKFINRLLIVIAIWATCTYIVPPLILGYKILNSTNKYAYYDNYMDKFYKVGGQYIQSPVGYTLVTEFQAEWLGDLTILTIVLLVIALIAGVIAFICAYNDGVFDDFFEKHTDPFFEKMCNFINRKNGGCNE